MLISADDRLDGKRDRGFDLDTGEIADGLDRIEEESLRTGLEEQ